MDKIRLRCKQKFLSDRCVRVNRTSNLHHQILRICITYYCNRNCSFCYSQGLQKEFKEHMSLADFEFLCRWARSQGWSSLRLLGGEPTMHPEFRAILDIARQSGFTISISSNGTYEPGIISSLDRALIESINFSYPQDDYRPQEFDFFQMNIKRVVDKKIPVVFSWVIYPDREDWQQIIDLAKKFQRRAIVRFSMVIPGHAKNFDAQVFKKHTQAMAKQILNIAHYAYENYVVFYFYRPLLPCMFNQAQKKFLRSISPFLFDSFCSCSCVEGTMLTVNPDLSCSPCPSLFLKGLKIAPDMTRETISQDFKVKLKQLSIQPLMEACQTCQYFINYKHYLEDKSHKFSSEELCHGGCFQYRA
ncbi:MAG: radical SAM protein [Candidatus Omnitrophica bacterium]|nr:radical SAM protein [Candidatus Omnitrophota bacterium]